MENQLKAEEQRILDYITQYAETHGYPPSVREICADLSVKSTATVFLKIKKLVELGFLKSDSNKKRSIEVVKPHTARSVRVPLVGTITAGEPILATQNIEDTYALPSDMFGNGELFMLKVRGESMINAGIFDGDNIVVRRQQTADNGQIVAVMIDDSATVKRFYKEDGHFRLQPENDTMQPIITDQAEILGLVVGLVRSMR